MAKRSKSRKARNPPKSSTSWMHCVRAQRETLGPTDALRQDAQPMRGRLRNRDAATRDTARQDDDGRSRRKIAAATDLMFDGKEVRERSTARYYRRIARGKGRAA